jgi:hypothetical protein
LTGAPTENAHPRHTPNPSSKYPPAPGFEKFSIIDTKKFYQTQSFSVFDSSEGYVKNVDYKFAYQDGRYDKFHSYNTDVGLEIFEFASPEKAQAFFKKKLARAIPEAQAAKVKLPPCKGKKSDNDDFGGPEKIVKKWRHQNGGEIVVTHSGDFNNFDCTRGSNDYEEVRWTDGIYYFEAEALHNSSKGLPKTGFGIAEEFAIDYLAALGQQNSQAEMSPKQPANLFSGTTTCHLFERPLPGLQGR